MIDFASQRRERQMRVFKNKPFARFVRRNEITDEELCKTIKEISRGLIAADLGGGIIKQRIARRGSGKSGGFRTLILLKVQKLAIFVHGFAKNDMENIRPDELAALKKLAFSLLAYGDDELKRAVANGTLIEVTCDGNREAVS
jgi:hypothetical protein